MKNVKTYAIVLIAALLTGCSQAQPPAEPSAIAEAAELPPAVIEAAENMPEPETASPEPEKPQKSPAEEMLEAMTLEEKTGQLFMLAFRGETELTATMAKTIEKYIPSGVILFSDNVSSKEQVSKLIEDLQSLAKIPLFIAVDEEGGRVSRVGGFYEEKIPAAGKTGSAEEAYTRGQTIGRRLNELGFNIAFSLVADINSNPANTVIGDRAFSSDPKTAADYVSAAVDGIKGTGILPVIKHFPGHGDTTEDSHYGVATATHDLDRLLSTELVPFAAGTGASGVMVGHISLPNVTGNNLPATFSEFLVTEILRGQLGFDGVVLTDAMDMGAITNYYSPGEAAVAAIEAGVDIVLMPADIAEAYNAVLAAYESGRLSEERIDASVLRILQLKSEIPPYGFSFSE